MSLHINYYQAAWPALEQLSPPPEFKLAIKKTDLTYIDIQRIIATKNNFELLKIDGSWEETMSKLPPFDRYLHGELMSREIEESSVTVTCAIDQPLKDYAPIFALLPTSDIHFIEYVEHTVDFNAPDDGVYYFERSRIDVDKMIRGSVQKIAILTPNTRELFDAYQAVKDNLLVKDMNATFRTNAIRNAAKKIRQDRGK